MTARRYLTLAAAHAAAFACIAHAQSTAPSTTTPPASAAEDETIKLSPFEVKAQNNHGYVASESLFGTRVATQIKDLPYQVNVLTSDMFKDFGFFELNENLTYISSLSNLDQGGGYNLRGFNQSYQLRDGFFRLGRYGTSNVDRVEVIKGPNASIYGQSQPGGMVNMISKRPKKTEEEEISYYTGSYNTTRVTAEAAGPTGLADTYYIFDYGYYEHNFDRDYSELRNKEYYGAIQHDFKNGGNLLLMAEIFYRDQHSPVNQIPENYNPTTVQYTGIAYNLANYNQVGPLAYQDRSIQFFTAIYEQRLNDTFSIKLGTNYGHALNVNFGNTNTVQYDVVHNTLARAAPARGLIDEVTFNTQADLLAEWALMDHKIKNRELLTIDVADYYRFDPTRNLRAGIPRGSTTITVGQPVDFYIPPYNTTDYITGYGIPGNNTGRWRHNRGTDFGTLYRHQTTLFNDRLLTFASLRYDDVRLSLRNYVGVPADQPVVYNSHLRSWTPSIGANFKLTKNISLYGSWSEGFNPLVQNQDAKAPLPAETARGFDYGIKTSFFDDRLSFTLGGYYITRANVVVTVTDAQGNSVNESNGGQLVRGVEFDSSWQVTSNWFVGAAWGHVDSRITNDGYKYMSIGRSAPRLAPDNVAVYTKYTVTHGIFKGVSANLGVSYSGPSHPENYNAGDVYTLDPTTKQYVYTGTNNQWALIIPGYAVWNGAVRYSFFTGGGVRLQHTIGLNVNNIFDKFYVSTARTVGDRRSFYVSYTLNH